ncbi:MerC domain-containing protein [Marivirga lumbricoides]
MISSTLCIFHCLITYLILAAYPALFSTSNQSFRLWGYVDFLLLGVSYLAVFRTIQQSNIIWIKISLLVTIVLLTFFIINERFGGIEFPIDMMYFPALAMIILHLVNLRKCRCKAGCCEKIQVSMK